MVKEKRISYLKTGKIYLSSTILASLAVILGGIDDRSHFNYGILIFILYIPLQSIYYYASKPFFYYRSRPQFIIGMNHKDLKLRQAVLERINYITFIHMQISSFLSIMVTVFFMKLGLINYFIILSLFCIHLIFYIGVDMAVRFKYRKKLTYNFENYRRLLGMNFQKLVLIAYAILIGVLAGILPQNKTIQDLTGLSFLVILVSAVFFYCVRYELIKINDLTEESPKWKISRFFWLSLVSNVILLSTFLYII